MTLIGMTWPKLHSACWSVYRLTMPAGKDIRVLRHDLQLVRQAKELVICKPQGYSAW